MTEKKKNALNHFLTVLLGFSIVLFVWTFSIGLPIYVRAFYYVQIDTLSIQQSSGYDKATIKQAYDDVLNYLTKDQAFGTGQLSCSESAKDHFADCKILFNVNLSLFVVSGVCIVVIVALALAKVIKLKKYKGLNVWFWSGIFAIALPLVVLLLAAINFDTAFVVFHKILFPGKTNWYFDPSKDEIIRILPEQFFANCGILIGSAIFAICVCLIAFEVARVARLKRLIRKNAKEQ